MTSKLPTPAEVTRLPKANLLGKERSLPTPTTPTSLKTNPPDCSLKASNKTKNNKKKKFIKTDTLHPSHEPISCLDTDPSLDTALRGLDLSLLLTHITPGVQTNPSLMTRQQMILARRLPLFNFPSTLYQPPPVLPPRRIPPTLDCCHDTDLPSYDPPDDTPVASGTAIGSLDDTLVDPLVFPVPTQPEQLSPYSPWPSDLPPYEPPYVRTPLPHEDPNSPPYDPPTDLRHDLDLPSYDPPNDTLLAACTPTDPLDDVPVGFLILPAPTFERLPPAFPDSEIGGSSEHT